MLSPDVELADLDSRHVRNAWRLLVPPRVWTGRWAIVVVAGGIDAPVRAIVARAGGRDVAPERTAAAYARQLAVDVAVVVDQRVLADIVTEIDGSLALAMDGAAQALAGFRAIKRRAGAGVWSEPPLLDWLPAPTAEPLQRTFDLLIPDRSAMVAYVIEDDRSRVHTSVIAVKHHGDVVRAATHRAVADLVPEAAFARDWAAQHGRVLSAIEERFAKPSIAVFLERATLLKIATGPSDQLARELDAKRVVIDPSPAWLLGLLGGAAMVALAGRAASALAAMMPKSARVAASSLASRAQTAMKDAGAHPFALLGFDPIELWQQVKHFYRP